MKVKRDMEKSTFSEINSDATRSRSLCYSHSKFTLVKSQFGQMTLEMILLTVVLLAVAIASTKALRDNQIIASLIGQPWAVVQGMIEDGVWVKQGTNSKANNPGMFKRRATNQGETT